MEYSRGLYFLDHTGAVIIDANRFSRAGNFKCGLASASINLQGTGFIDCSGEFVIEPGFAGARSFSDGLAAVQPWKSEPSKWAYIDTAGEMVIDGKFDAAYDFSEGLALVRNGTNLFFIDRSGNKTLELSTDDVALEFSGDQKFSEGLIVGRDKKSGLCGFLDTTGRFELEPKFHNAANFSEGLARVSVIREHREYLGFIDRAGQYIIQPEFDIDCDFLRSATEFSEELASVINGPPTMDDLNPGCIYIDRTGEIVLETAYAYAGPFREGLAAVYSAEKKKWGLIDKTENFAIPIEFDFVGEMSEGLVSAGIHGF